MFKFNPTIVHNFFVSFGKKIGDWSSGRFLTNLIYGYRGIDISKMVDGIYYKTPILLSAGFDYNGNLTQILPSLSFGGAEIGSVTARPCIGNPEPSLKRLPFSKSIIVNKGLKNDGVDAVIDRLKKVKRIKKFVVGISIARTNDSCATTVENGIADYVYSLKKIVENDIGDYYTINISCPNSFGGETFADVVLLEKLFSEIDKVKRKKPLYVKMPISVTNNIFLQLMDVLKRHSVQGVIIGNLQKDYKKIDNRDVAPQFYSGGLSGKPCEERSNELIRLAKNNFKNHFTIIGCGGIFSYDDAKNKFDAGADLIQLITGMIYEGPGLVKKICKGISTSSVIS